MKHTRQSIWNVAILALLLFVPVIATAADRLVFEPPASVASPRHIVLVSGDEEYRTEESMPMLAKILSQKHGFKCTVLFAFGPDGADYIDANNSSGIRGWDSLDSADLMIIGTRFREPSEEEARYVTNFLNAGKPVIGIRTATHAFNGQGDFGGLAYGEFGREILGETWVSHHGQHKKEGARGMIVDAQQEHPILNAVQDVFCPSDVYGVIHLTDEDKILMRAAVTATLDPSSPNVEGKKNAPMQPFAWLHTYRSPNGEKQGRSFCTTGGASVDFVSEDLRRMIINAALYLTDREVPAKADVAFVDAFYPSFYGFISEPTYWKNLNRKPEDFELGKSPHSPDPQGTPEWNFRPRPELSFNFKTGQRIAMVGGSLAERMNLFGSFETLLHTRFPDKQLVIRNFGWPADEVGNQQRPDDYASIDDPMVEFGPDLFICFFGFNEHFAGDSEADVTAFKQRYLSWIETKRREFSKDGRAPTFILVSPMAVENAANEHLPNGEQSNQAIAKYTAAVKEIASENDLTFVDVFSATQSAFAAEVGLQYTINGIHCNEQGDRLVAEQMDSELFATPHPTGSDVSTFHAVRAAVNDKAWLHLQDYRMLNGWYVYGGRRTWDTETFPGEYQKIRKMVAVRDRYIWDMVAGKSVPEVPDDSGTGEVFIPETMFGTRDEGFRQGREPRALVYPTPEESIAQMSVPEGFEVQLFASEREFPEFSNPTQMAFDSKGRLWVSCMVNYPQWLPGSAKPGDKLLIFEDTNGDGKADVCKTFYDKLICPTGFEFYEDGVLVVDEPRIIFLKDTDHDDVADSVTHVIDGIATDDTHHAMGAWEWSHGGLLYMLEGVAMSTTLETPWGPFRNKGPSGAYVLDPKSWKFRHFRTPGYGNPWCMVFDRWGMGTIGDGTNAQQHWTSPLSGKAVNSRKTLRPNFDNQGMRPAVGNEWLWSRHFPDDVQGQFSYSCVINMHGMPRFTVDDEPGTAGFAGQRIDDLIDSTDNFFRPVDAQIGPDGALWFGDWCNALIGHMQYSQRDPNRDHVHGRLYRLVYKNKPLLEPELQTGQSIAGLLRQLESYELRTRYRARRELRAKDKSEVYAAIDKWLRPNSGPEALCEAMWLQESFRDLQPALVNRLLAHSDFHARAAVVHSVANEFERYPNTLDVFRRAVEDEHPRVRLEAVRGLSYIPTAEAAEIALQVIHKPLDYWVEYTLEHTLQALEPFIAPADRAGQFLAGGDSDRKDYYANYVLSTGPGGEAVQPLKDAENPELPMRRRLSAIGKLAEIRGGRADQGQIVFSRVCSACHQIGDVGKAFGPKLDDVGGRYTRPDIIKHVLWPNETIAKGYETVQVLTIDGEVFNGFVMKDDGQVLTLGVATNDGKGREQALPYEDIEVRKEMKASSMPEGLAKTIAPSEFLDLLEYLADQNQFVIKEDGWIETGAADFGELRKSGGFVEISRDGQLQLGNNFDGAHSKYANLVLSAVDPSNREFAFHSPNNGSNSPAVVVRLAELAEIRHIEIQNRRNPQFYDRAKDLAVWVSEDGETWKSIWTSSQPAAEYSIDLPAGTRGQYVKFGLDGNGIFHLNQISIYGKR